MTVQNTTLADFSKNNSNNQNSRNESIPESESGGNPDKSNNGVKGDDTVCPYYSEDLARCEEQLDNELVDYLSLSDIKCGHAINYICSEVNVRLSKHTARGYSSYLRKYIEFLHSSNTTVCESEIKHVKDYMKSLVRQGRAEETLQGYRSAITNLYKHIAVYRDIEPSINWSVITEVIDTSEYNTPEPREREPLTKEEVKKLYQELDNFRNRLMVQVGVELGPRNKAIRSIKTNDVDFENSEIELSNTKAGGTYTVPMSHQLSLLLKRWIKHERPAHPGAENNDYLFPSTHGGMLGGTQFRQIVKQAAEDAGIQEKEKSSTKLSTREREAFNIEEDYVLYYKVTPHVLRHTCNYLMEEAGIPLDARSKVLDHENSEVTEDYYGFENNNYKELLKEIFTERDSLID